MRHLCHLGLVIFWFYCFSPDSSIPKRKRRRRNTGDLLNASSSINSAFSISFLLRLFFSIVFHLFVWACCPINTAAFVDNRRPWFSQCFKKHPFCFSRFIHTHLAQIRNVLLPLTHKIAGWASDVALEKRTARVTASRSPLFLEQGIKKPYRSLWFKITNSSKNTKKDRLYSIRLCKRVFIISNHHNK